MGTLCRPWPRHCRRPLSASSPPSGAPGWVVAHEHDTAARLHSRSHRTASGRTVRVCWPTDRAVVLGSTQSSHDFVPDELEALGIGIVRRRSGGGAVLLRRSGQLWVDVFVPATDDLFDSDVVRSFHWLGESFAAALDALVSTALGADGAARIGRIEVHRGGLERDGWVGRVCFAGVGAGEVTAGGRKVVGISQRRDRSGAWFQAVALLEPDQEVLADLLDLPEAGRAEAHALLARAGMALGAGALRPDDLLAELLAHLPRAATA